MSVTRGALKTVDITTFFPTIKMLAISQADNLVYFYNLTSWELYEELGTPAPKTISGATYTLQSADVNNIYTNVAGCEVTVPAGISLYHSSYHTCIENADVTFVEDGTTINNFNGNNASNGQFAVAALFQSSQDVFILGGNTKTV